MKYYDIHMVVKDDCKEGYSVFLAMPDNAGEGDAIAKMKDEHLYEEPEDLDNIDYIGEVSEKEFKEARGIHDIYNFDIIVYAGIVDTVKNGYDVLAGIKDQLEQGDPACDELFEEIQKYLEITSKKIDLDNVSIEDIMPFIAPNMDTLEVEAAETYELDDPNCVALQMACEFTVQEFVKKYSFIKKYS